MSIDSDDTNLGEFDSKETKSGDIENKDSKLVDNFDKIEAGEDLLLGEKKIGNIDSGSDCNFSALPHVEVDKLRSCLKFIMSA